MRAWQMTRYGRPSQTLELVDVPAPEPGPGEILVRTSASVCNYNDVDGCHGRYLTINRPFLQAGHGVRRRGGGRRAR